MGHDVYFQRSIWKKKNCFDLVSKTKTNTNMIKINIAVQYIVTYVVK